MTHPETVKVVSDNPSHEQGFIVKNKADLKPEDVIFGEKAPEGDDDHFADMDADALRAYLTEHGEKPHHMTGEAKLRDACRKLATDSI